MSRSTVMCISFVIVSLMFAGQSYAKIDPGNILGAWLLDEGTGAVAVDASGNGRDGTIAGSPAWIAGQWGTALRFTGSGTYVNCGNPDAFNVSLFSISFWYNFPATQSWNHMISRGQHVASGTPGSVNWGVMMYDAQQTILYETYNNTSWTGISVPTTAGAWHHVVATYDGATMQIYHDGQLAGSASNGILLDASRPLIIGGRSDAGSVGGLFNGSLDEVGYFNTVLALEDVQVLMKEGLSAVTANPRARRPDPRDGAVHTATWVNLAWAPGDGAVSHDVYLGESFADVNSGAAGTFKGNVATPFFTAGFFGVPYPDGLVPGTTYYWRIDEVNPADPNSPWKGPVWSFSVPPRKAYNPSPANGAKYVATDVALNWTGGLGAKLHYVYFGDNADTVGNATGGLPRGTATYTPAGPLVKGKTYYWRVDQFDGSGTYKGDVWSFTTLPDIPQTDPNLVGWWKLDEGMGTTALDWSGRGNHGTLRGGPQWAAGFDGGALALDGVDDYVDVPHAPILTVNNQVTVMAWINASRHSGPPGQDYQGIIAKGNTTRSYSLYTQTAGTLHFSTTSAGAYVGSSSASQVPLNEWVHVAAMVVNGQHRYFINGNDAGTAQSGITLPGAADSANVVIGRTQEGSTRSFLGMIDDARIYNKALTQDQIKQVMRGDVSRAWNPSPANGSTSDVVKALPLSWSRGDKASQHDVYFGLDKNAVANASASDTTGVYRGRQSATSYTPPEGVQFNGGPYYWRIDEVNTDGTITAGTLWRFSVAAYILVDDFESYNDIAAGQAGSNLVYMTWLDGFGTTTNGSTMGYPTGSSLETANVHGGTKAVPLIYNNATASYSEVERTFAAQDWTSHGIQTLSLWFFGDSANVPGQLYVKINGVKVPYTGNAADLKKPIWQLWNIPLASVGTNLKSVTKLAIGIETKGTTGTLLLDDIELYPTAPVVGEQVWLEAEAGTITAPLKTYADPLASGGSYIGTDDGSGDESANPPATGVATYSFTAQGGVYKISLRVIITGGSNSFWVRVPTATKYDPGTHASGWVRFNDISDGAAWHWDDVHSSDHANQVVSITIPAGANTLEIARREDGAFLDAIVIAKID